jgi:hypothetical protein
VDGHYDIAQICRRGHIINQYFQQYPRSNQKFCDFCGYATVVQCENCHTPIRGGFIDEYGGTNSPYTLPNYCHSCGRPYSWTEFKLQTARELVEELEGLSNDDRRILNQSLDELIADSPKVEVASVRFKKIMKNVGKESYDVVKTVLTDLISETTKKLLFGP